MTRLLCGLGLLAAIAIVRVVVRSRKAPQLERLAGSKSLDRAFTHHRNRLARTDELWSRR